MSERARVAVPVTTLWRDPGAVRPVDEAIVRAWPEPAVWLRTMDIPERRALQGLADSQALLGEDVAVEEERDGWSRVSLSEQPAGPAGSGYEGWLPSAHLEAADVDGGAGSARRVVARRLVEVRESPAGRVMTFVSIGSRFSVIDEAGEEVAIRLAGGRTGWVREDATEHEAGRPAWSGGTPAAVIRRRVLDDALRFVGVPYLWGGLSGFGVDCSGLVHLACRMAGLRIPRDANDQALAPGPANSVPTDAGACWMVYFARSPETGEDIHHVGLAVDDRSMVHAPATGRVVELASYREGNYAKELYRRRDPVKVGRR